MSRKQDGWPVARSCGVDDIKRTGLSFARGGIAGLLIWIFRDEIQDRVARHLSGRVAAGLAFAGYVLIRIANDGDVDVLRVPGWFLLVGAPLFWIMARDERLRREVRAMEHGRDTEAYRAAEAADRQRRDEQAFADDLVVFPPWGKSSGQDPDARPQFGRKG